MGGLDTKNRAVLLFNVLLPNGSEERGVLGVWSIPVAILPSGQDITNIAVGLRKYEY